MIEKSEKFNAVFGQILGTFWTCFPCIYTLGVKGENKKPPNPYTSRLESCFLAVFLIEKKIDKTPLQELRFKCSNQTKNSESGACYVCLYISKNNPDNKNFYDENGILETGTGEILSDPRKTERSDLGKCTR